VHTRLLLIHLPSRDEVLRRLAPPSPRRRADDRGGRRPSVLATADGPYLAPWHASLEMTREAGVDPRSARDLPQRLTALGLVDVDAEIATQLFRGGSEPAQFWSLHLAADPRRRGRPGIPGEIVDAGRAALDDDTRWFHGPATVIAWGPVFDRCRGVRAMTLHMQAE
jgi:hypothetical protein